MLNVVDRHAPKATWCEKRTKTKDQDQVREEDQGPRPRTRTKTKAVDAHGGWHLPGLGKKNRIVVLRSSDRHGTHQQRIGYTRWSVFFCVNVYRHQRYSKADVGPRSIGICFKKSNCLLTRTVNIQWLNCIIRCESGRTFFGYNLRNRKHERVQVARLLDVGSVNPACRDGGHLP